MSAAAIAVAAAAVSIGTGVASAQSGKKAASKAAQNSRDQALLEAKQLFASRDEANSLLQPYANTGLSANKQLAYELGLGGKGSGKAGILNQRYGMDQYKTDPGYTPMVNDLASLQATPGYKFQLQQGLQGVNNSAAARGSLLSGKQLKGINTYAQGVASQGYQSAWDRAQQAYQNAFSRNQSTNAQRYNQLSGVTGTGFNAANAQGINTLNTANAVAKGSQNMTNAVNQSIYAASQAQQNQNASINNGVQGLLSYGASAYGGGAGGAAGSGGNATWDADGVKRIG